MKPALVIGLIGLLGCKKSTKMPAIPGATIDKLVTAMSAVCASPKAGPIEPYNDNPIADADVEIPCTLSDDWTPVDQNEKVLQFVPHMGGWAQLDGDGIPSLFELQVSIKPSEANGFTHKFLRAFGVPLETFEKVKGRGDYLFHEPDYRIFVTKLRNAQLENLLLSIRIDNLPGDD